jgi:hypothetical protein
MIGSFFRPGWPALSDIGFSCRVGLRVEGRAADIDRDVRFHP